MKIIALSGLLGYGYSEEGLRKAFETPPDFVGVDGGSTDPGPYYLGSGQSFTDRSAVKRDVALALPLALNCGAPFIVGTSGGSGAAVHLAWLKDIFLEIAREKKLSFRMALIDTEVEAGYVLQKLEEGKLSPMGPQLTATEESIRESAHLVSQIGVAPILAALEGGADVILAGRACDTAIYAAPCIWKGYDPGLSFHMAKIMECGSMCAHPVAAADVMQAQMEQDYFELTPANPMRNCTIERVAAHTMYEQADPYLIYEPDGVVDVRDATYEQVSDRTVRVSGSKFFEAEKKTLKIEGARLSGYRTIALAGVNDPETIRRMDEIFQGAKKFAGQAMEGQIAPESYTIRLLQYGQPLYPERAPALPENSLGVVIDVVGKTQEIADTVCALIRARMLHYDYAGRKTTAGNLAFPYSPSDIHMGAVYEFSLYHLAEVDDLGETAKMSMVEVRGDEGCGC